MLRFIALFALILFTLFGLELLQPVQQHVVLPWTALLARFCVALVSLFDGAAMAQGKVLWNPSNGFGVSIEPGCNGVEAFIVLSAAMLAFPAAWRSRLWGLGVGFLAIQALNVVRVISLFYIGQWNKEAFEFAHAYLWQALIMLDVLVVWLLWVRLAAPPGPTIKASARASA
jgi:exosortase H (IPTLxxWG-CTERM-specific)